MESSQDRVAALRADLAGTSGPARVYKLIALSGALSDRWQRTGVKSPAGSADLDAEVDALAEAYGYLEPGHPHRPMVGHRLGALLAMRSLVLPRGGDRDQETARQLLEESLDVGNLAPENAISARLALAQLHLVRAMQGIATIDLPTAMKGGGVAPEFKASAEQAVSYARQVVEAPVVLPGLSDAARMALDLAEAVRDQLDGMSVGVLGLDLELLKRMIDGAQKAQAMEAQAAAANASFWQSAVDGFSAGVGGPGKQSPSQPPTVDTFTWSEQTTVVHGTEPGDPPAAPKPPPAAVPADVGRLRAELAHQFAVLVTAARHPDSAEPPAVVGPVGEPPEAYRSAAALLRPDGVPLPVDPVDACVALATILVHETTAAADPARAGVDRFLLAVALFLRARSQGAADDGWASADADDWGGGASGDLGAGADQLRSAAQAVPPEHPAAVEVVKALGAFLDDRQPLLTVTDDIGRAIATLADAVVAVRADQGPDHPAQVADLAVVDAVRAVCRTAVAVRAGTIDGTAELTAAVAAVPERYPWYVRLRVAAALATVAEACSRRDTVALRAAGALVDAVVAAAPDWYTRSAGARVAGRLAAVLGGLGGDVATLRAAVAGLAEVTGPPAAGTVEAFRLHAVLGALRLALADGPRDLVTGTDAGGGLTLAIESLNLATTGLTADADAVLRSASDLRLAEAYRRRGTERDLDRARVVAIRALRGPGLDRAGISRLASLLWQGGGALEAFEALERAAGAGTDPLDPLARDVATVLLGLDVAPGASSTEAGAGTTPPPTASDVAAALRAMGAVALACLHPLDGHPGKAGVLVLEASTGRLALFGPVDVPDCTAAAPPADRDGSTWTPIIELLLNLPTTDAAPRRVLLAATGPLGRFPLPALQDSSGDYVTRKLIVSQVASGRQVVELARRTPLPVTDRVVFVANPRGDRDFATFEAITLRRAFYPRSIGLGRTVEQVDGAGTPAEVLAHLPGPTGPGAGLLHVDCGLRTTGTPALELVELGGHGSTEDRPAVLDVEQIGAQAARRRDRASGGLAILPADTGAHDEQWVRFADTLLDAGLTGVIGWRWAVPGPIAAVMRYVLHGKLSDEGLPPATAVREVHRWMLEPDPAELPAGLAAALNGADVTDPGYWAALCHRGV